MPSRRRVLATAGSGLAASVGLAGCSFLGGMPQGISVAVGPPDPTPTPTPTDSPTGTADRTVTATRGASGKAKPDDGGPGDGSDGRETQTLRYRDLTDPEQALVRKALDGGYRTCDEVPDAANALADRIETNYVYLTYGGELRGLWLTITDLAYASTTDPPEGDCGVF